MPKKTKNKQTWKYVSYLESVINVIIKQSEQIKKEINRLILKWNNICINYYIYKNIIIYIIIIIIRKLT